MRRLRAKATLVLATIFAISGILLVGNLPLGFAQNGTNENGVITSDTTWTKENSPYTFIGPVAVGNGATLTIEPGVTVNLADYYIQVNGTIVAKGTSTNKIYFNGGNSNSNDGSPNSAIAFTSRSISWNELTGSGSIIENTVINTQAIGISIDRASPKINQNSITGNYAIGVLSGSPVISNNVLVGNVGVSSSDSITITGNNIKGTIYANQGTVLSKNTIIGPGEGVGVYSSGASITDNKIIGFQQGISTFDYVSSIERNIIAYNEVGIQVGSPDYGYTFSQMPPTQHDFQVTIQNNLITKNSKGISVTHLPLNAQVAHFKATITNNNILDNTEYNFFLADTSISINAANNWWGTTDAQAINAAIHEYKNDFNIGNVTFVPFLTSADSQSPNPNTPIPTITPASTQTPTSPSPTTPNLSPTSSQNPATQPATSQTILYIIAILLATIVVLLVALLVIVLRRKREKRL